MSTVMAKLQAYMKRYKLKKLKKALKSDGQTITGWVNREADKVISYAKRK